MVTDTTPSDDQFRVAAIDRFGRAHQVAQGGSGSNGNSRRFQASFRLPIADVARFELQRRPIAWAEFPNVVLKPGAGFEPVARPAPKPRRDAEARARSRLQFRLVAGAPAGPGDIDAFRPTGAKLAQAPPRLEADVPLDDADVADVVALGWGSGFAVWVTFTAEGAEVFADLARRFPRRRLAVVLDGKVLDASMIGAEPDIREFATGPLTRDEAKALAASLLDVTEPGITHDRPGPAEVVESRPLMTLGDGQYGVDAFDFDRDGSTLLALGKNAPDRVGVQPWAAGSARPQPAFPGLAGLKRGLALSPFGGLAAGEDSGHSVTIWDARSGRSVAVIPTAHAKRIKAAAFSPDGKTLATSGVFNTPAGGDQDEVKLWDAATGALIRAHRGLSAGALAFSPDGKTLATAGDDRRVTLWDAATGEVVATLRGHRGTIMALAFAPNGKTLVTGDYFVEGREIRSRRIGWKEVAGEVKLWDAATGELKQTFTGLPDAVVAVAVSPDGAKVVGGTLHGAVARVWDASTGATLGSFGQPDIGVIAARFVPDGRTLVTVGSEGKIRIWSLPRPRP